MPARAAAAMAAGDGPAAASEGAALPPPACAFFLCLSPRAGADPSASVRFFRTAGPGASRRVEEGDGRVMVAAGGAPLPIRGKEKVGERGRGGRGLRSNPRAHSLSLSL